MSFRIGQGYDVHRLEKGRKLILGGVEIPFELGLLGHSDADVLVHAIIDAVCGASGLGDIGSNFPDTDPKYKGASSIRLLQEIGQKITALGWGIENIDATIVAQAPKLLPYKAKMVENIANALNISQSRVNIKATTEEGLGFTGTGEGMASYAVCLLKGDIFE